MSYFEIGIYHPKTETNVGTLLRSAYQLGAAGVYVIGPRYRNQASNTYKTERHIPLRCLNTFDDFLKCRPHGAQIVAVEMGGIKLKEFKHPKQAIYLLGAEDHGLPESVISRCNHLVALEAVRQLSYNVAVAGSLIMYYRNF